MPRDSLAGVGFALSAFLLWGFMPIYFKAVAGVPLLEIVAHRVIWSIPILILIVTVARGWSVMVMALRDRRTQLMILTSSVLMAANWLIFIWAVGAGRILESSLGYYINPLMNVLLGVLVLRERLGVVQTVAVALAAVGVLNLVVQAGSLPWVSLSLAATFAVYGLIRKTVPLGPAEGLLVETLLLMPAALGYIIFLSAYGSGTFGAIDWTLDGLVMLSGLVTIVPLIAFTAGARRLNYATIGIFQYIAPTCHFVLAVYVYGEPFTRAHTVTFALIWLALAIYSFQLIRGTTRPARA